MKKSNLILHCGARHINRERLNKIPAPKPTVSWHPVRYGQLIDEVERSLKAKDLKIISDQYGVTEGNKKMFGLLQIGGMKEQVDYGFVIGVRGSIDKTMAEGIACGASVFVCDNMSFSSEVVMNRKNTRNVMEDLPLMVDEAIAKVSPLWNIQNIKFDTYKECEMSKEEAWAAMGEAFEKGVFPWVKGERIIKEFSEPRHPEFKGNTVWSFFNAVTEHLKPRDGSMNVGLWSLPQRTEELHNVCDSIINRRIKGEELILKG